MTFPGLAPSILKVLRVSFLHVEGSPRISRPQILNSADSRHVVAKIEAPLVGIVSPSPSLRDLPPQPRWECGVRARSCARPNPHTAGLGHGRVWLKQVPLFVGWDLPVHEGESQAVRPRILNGVDSFLIGKPSPRRKNSDDNNIQGLHLDFPNYCDGNHYRNGCTYFPVKIMETNPFKHHIKDNFQVSLVVMRSLGDDAHRPSGTRKLPRHLPIVFQICEKPRSNLRENRTDSSRESCMPNRQIFLPNFPIC